MARVKIDLPGKKLTTVQVPVRITDINYGNHLGNDSLVSILHEARVLWLYQHRFSELNAGGTALIMRDLAVEFLAESFYGNNLEITLWAGEISRVGFELFYEVKTMRNDIITQIAKAKTGMLCFDYEARKLNTVPPDLANILQTIKP